MKVEPKLNLQTPPSSAQTRRAPSPRIVLFADFLPVQSEQSLAASALVSAGLSSGRNITTATCTTDSFAQFILCTRTPMNFQRAIMQLSKMRLAQAEHVIVVLDCFANAELQSTTRFRRLKERRRNMMILAEILRQRPGATVIGSGVQDRIFLRSAQILALSSGAPIPSLDTQPNSVLLDGSLAKSLKLDLENSKSASALRLMRHHAEFGLGVHRISARRILKADTLKDHDNELKILAQLATGAGLKNHPTVLRLRAARALRDPVCETQAPHPLMELAQALSPEGIKFDVPLSRYMMQFHTVLNLDVEFPLTSRSEAEAYILWYRRRGFERSPSHWLPPAPVSDDYPLPRRVGNPLRANTKAERTYRMVLDILNDPSALFDDGDPTLRYLSSNPVGIGPSRFAVLMAILCQIPCQFDPEKLLWKSEDIRIWFNATVCSLIPGYRRFSTPQSRRKHRTPRVDIYGMPNSSTGLGTNTHMAEMLFSELDIPYALHYVEDQDRNIQFPARRGGTYPLKKNLVLHQMNADRIQLFMMSPELARRNDQFHIGYLLWELGQIPDAHHLGIEMLDEIWTPSRFVTNLYRAQSETPVHLVKKGLVHLEALKLMTLRQGDRNQNFTALVCFDFHSSVERKNPLVAVQGFLTAFPKRQYGDCRLIVKTTPTSLNHWGDPTGQMAQIYTLARTDKRIQIIDQFLPQAELWQLMAAADCLLSTHRAEGFGYIPAYALALGKPLVTTNYGGSTDFCSPRTSFPVEFELVEVPNGHALYFQPGAKWADTAPDAVAAQLQNVYSDIGSARDRGRFGQKFMSREYSVAAYAARCKQRLINRGIL